MRVRRHVRDASHLAAREARHAGGVARDAVVDEDHLPVVVGERVVLVELADEEALRLVVLHEDAVELLAVAADDVERGEQPAVGGALALDDPLHLEVVLEEHRRRHVRHLTRPQPLRHDGVLVGARAAAGVHLRLGARRAPRRLREALVDVVGVPVDRRDRRVVVRAARVLEEPAVRLRLRGRVRHQRVAPLLDVLGERLPLDRHHRHVLLPLLEPDRLLELHPLGVPVEGNVGCEVWGLGRDPIASSSSIRSAYL